MEQSSVLDFLKEVGVGFKAAKSYPPGHPVMDRVIDTTMSQLLRLYNRFASFSFYFLEQTVIFEDQRYDITKNAAILALLEALRKNEINSLSFEPEVSAEDVRNLYETISSPRLKVRQAGDAAAMLVSMGTRKIKINAVKFGIQDGKAKQVAQEPSRGQDPHAVIEDLRALKSLLEKGAGGSGGPGVGRGRGSGKGASGAEVGSQDAGASVTVDEDGVIHVDKGGHEGVISTETREKFNKIITDLSDAAQDSQKPYGEAVARLINTLPPAQRAELFQDVELKPFVLKLFSHLDENTLTKLLVSRMKGKDSDDVKKIISAVGAEKVAKVAPSLQDEIPELNEYLAEFGVLVGELREKLKSTVSKDDLRATLKSYYSMLESQNPHVRQEGLKSLIRLASTFVEHGNYENAKDVILRISASFSQESVTEVISKSVSSLDGLYKLSREAEQSDLCSLLLEPFTKILGRGGLPAPFKRKIVNFFGSTNNPAVLPTLFSFLWDTGIYPDVRAAIVPFGKDAVTEALLTLKEAENPALRQKLVDVLKRIGKDSIDTLLENLDGAEWYLRRSIIAILGDIGDKSVVQELAAYVDDNDDRVRLAAVKSFAQLHYDEGLLKALDDASVEIRAEALRGLRKRIKKDQVKDLFHLFKERGENVHAELLKIIKDKNVPEAMEPIAEYLRSLEGRPDPSAKDLKEMAVAVLLRFDPEKTKSYFEEFKDSKDKTLSHLSQKALDRIEH